MIIRNRPSIAQAIFLLVFATLGVATLATFAITFRGPPPRPEPVQVGVIAQMLDGKPHPDLALSRSGPIEGPYDRPPPGGPFGPERSSSDSRALEVAAAGHRFPPRADERADPRRDAIIASALGAAPGSVAGSYSEFGPRSRDVIFGDFTLTWRGPAGVRSIRTLTQPVLTKWHLITGATMLAAFLLLLIPAWWTANRISRPLRRLAAAARRARIGQAVEIPREGPREARELADAFSAMQARLAADAEGRTVMLVAIAHDLGTPLSRLAFWIEQLPDAARERAAADVDEMRGMLGQALRVARDERVTERVRLDLGSVVESLVDDLAAAGSPVTVVPGPRVLIDGDAAALRRLFQNLIENAIRYGDRAQVAWSVADGAAVITVADGGAGFDPALAERAFEPFVRGEPSRNRATGGTGLGLAIVRKLAEAHGGAVTLGRGADGGGLVTVTMPLDRT